MGFYGNITNTSMTSFSFDRIYPNKYTMMSQMAKDQIYLGRYVLVDYDNDTGGTQNQFLTSMPRVYLYNGNFYTSVAHTDLVKADGVNIIVNKTIVYTTITGEKGESLTVNDNDPQRQALEKVAYYICVGTDEYGNARFNLISRSDDNAYSRNYAIDKAFYGEIGRGFDSTVWQKAFQGNEETFISIAELNSVVPTFAIQVDPPTNMPTVPHFDAMSSSVYYKLHLQPNWGFRVKVADNEDFSDVDIPYNNITYDTTSHSTVVTPNGQTRPGAIYFNKAAFAPQIGAAADNISKHSSLKDNYIQLLPTGSSTTINTSYEKYSGFPNRDIKDIQEFSLSLPAIGDMMSDSWDIIHGPNRDNSTSDSLQGRLDFFTKEISKNEIPLQSVKGGYLVGTTINGNTKCSTIKDANTLIPKADNLVSLADYQSADQDDPWIMTEINISDTPKKGETQYHRNSIRIHHDFHGIEDTISQIDMNSDADKKFTQSAWVYDENDARAEFVFNENDKEKIDFETYYVDATGHVIGRDYKRVQLPYSFKTIKTNGRSTVETENASNNPTTTNILSKNTQDTLNINSNNKWIRIDTNNTNNSIAIAHDVHTITTTKIADSNLNNLTEAQVAAGQDKNKITLQDLTFDAAGHVTANQKHTYTLPYGFKKISTNGRANSNVSINTESNPQAARTDIIANNAQDTLKVNSGNTWVRIDTTPAQNTIAISHDVHAFTAGQAKTKTGLAKSLTVNDATFNTNRSFIVPNFTFDEAGHFTAAEEPTITLPANFTSIKVTGTNASVGSKTTSTTADIEPATLTDSINISSGNKWILLDSNATSKSITASHYVDTINNATKAIDLNSNNTFSINEVENDEAGHIIKRTVTTYTLPYNFKTINITNNKETNSNQVSETFSLVSAINASSQVDAITLNGGNRWIQVSSDNTNGNLISLLHAPAGDATTKIGYEDNQEISLGESFNTLSLGIDAAGHISSENVKEVKIKGTDELKLNNFTDGTGTNDQLSDKTLNEIFDQLGKAIDNEVSERETAVAGVQDFIKDFYKTNKDNESIIWPETWTTLFTENEEEEEPEET